MIMLANNSLVEQVAGFDTDFALLNQRRRLDTNSFR
jgi:hypothetical protein